MQIVAESGEGSAALELCRRHEADVVIMDLRLPGLSGFDAIQLLHQELPGLGILVLSNYEGSEDVHRALSSGALAYLTKDAGAENSGRGVDKQGTRSAATARQRQEQPGSRRTLGYLRKHSPHSCQPDPG